MLVFLAAAGVSACDFWPRDLEPLARSIARQVSGETTARLAGGDVVVIDVSGSPHPRDAEADWGVLAIGIAEQAIDYLDVPLESVVVTFHEGEISEDPESMREFVFLVADRRPVLQPTLDLQARGPLQIVEIQSQFVDWMEDSLTPEQRDCALEEAVSLARIAGDPETLDPARVDLLPAEHWHRLDAFGRRLILMQAVTTRALFNCASRHRYQDPLPAD